MSIVISPYYFIFPLVFVIKRLFLSYLLAPLKCGSCYGVTSKIKYSFWVFLRLFIHEICQLLNGAWFVAQKQSYCCLKIYNPVGTDFSSCFTCNMRSLCLKLIQDQSESNSERVKDKNLYLSEEAGLTPLLGKIQYFEDCDWLVVHEGNKRGLLRLGFIVSLHFEITGVFFSYSLSLSLSLSLSPSLSLSLSLSLSHTHTHTHYICIYILYFLFTMLSYLTYFIGNEQ